MGTSTGKGDGALGTHFFTGVSQTTLAAVGDKHTLFRAGMAGKFDDVDQRRVIVFAGDGAFFNAIGNRRGFRSRTHRQANGQTQTFTNNGAFQEHAVAIRGFFPGNDFKGKLLDLFRVVAAFISHAGNLGENFSSDLCDRRIDSSHEMIHLSSFDAIIIRCFMLGYKTCPKKKAVSARFLRVRL